jgi:hypothetical protein
MQPTDAALRAEAGQDYLTAYLREQIEYMIREVDEELGLGDVRGDPARTASGPGRLTNRKLYMNV